MAAVDYITRGEYKAQVEKTGTDRDGVIDALITAASEALNARYRRELTPKTASATRTFRVRPSARIIDLDPYDLRSATTVTLESTPLVANEDYVLEWESRKTSTYLAVRLGASVVVDSTFVREFGYGRLSIAGAWGAWDTAEVLADVKRACVATVGSWLDRAIEAYGLDLDEPRTLAALAQKTWAIPPAAHTIMVAAGMPRMTTV
jgi:hypothetical protein